MWGQCPRLGVQQLLYLEVGGALVYLRTIEINVARSRESATGERRLEKCVQADHTGPG